MSDPGRFHPTELDLDLDAESAELLATARDLEAYAATGLTSPSVGFEDRVMAAIADEPMPRAAGRGFLATVRDAWTIAFAPGRSIALRAQALAMLLALAIAVGSVGTVAVVGAARLLGQPATPPTVPSPSPLPSPSVTPSPTPSPSTSPSPTPTPTLSPSASPDDSDEPAGTDDHGGGSGSGSSSGSGSDDSSGSGGSGSDPSSDDSDSRSGKSSGAADPGSSTRPDVRNASLTA